MNSQTRDPWDSLLFKAMQTRNPSRAPLSDHDLLEVALGRRDEPAEIDDGERQLLAMMRDVVSETEGPAPEKESGFFQFLALAVGSSIRALAATFEMNQAQFVPVRSDAATGAVEGTTAYGTRVLIAGSVRGNPEITLSWNTGAPGRVVMHRDGNMLESAPVEGNEVVFPLREKGIYSFQAKTAGEVVERITISVDD